jgi:hypothetical protein
MPAATEAGEAAAVGDAAAAPADDPEPRIASAAFAAPADVDLDLLERDAVAAGEVLIPFGQHGEQGRNIRQVYELGPDAHTWFEWMLGSKAKQAEHPIVYAATVAFVKVRLPDTWAKHHGGGAS